jgi:hypothetical protein
MVTAKSASIAATVTHVTIEELFEDMFSMRSMPGLYSGHQRGKSVKCKRLKLVGGQADPTYRQRGRPISTNPQSSDSNENLVLSPRWALYSKIDWPTNRRS